jgi:hypothetical protein
MGGRARSSVQSLASLGLRVVPLGSHTLDTASKELGCTELSVAAPCLGL